jgi:F-type H+-transporting ATPase subunit b
VLPEQQPARHRRLAFTPQWCPPLGHFYLPVRATTLALSGVLNVALVIVLCSFAFSGRQTGLSAGLTRSARANVRAPMVRAPSRNLAAFAAKNKGLVTIQQVHARDVPAGKMRIRVGAPAAAVAAAGMCSLASALPALAAGGQLFDFDLTLPYMATEIMLLSFFLDKLWFSPLGQLIEQRKSQMRGNLESAAGNLEECDNIIAFAEQSLRDLEASFRTETEEKLKGLNAECDAAMAATKAKVDAEIDDALNGIEKDRQVVLSDMNNEIESFCWEILEKVLPEEAENWKKEKPGQFTVTA